MIYSQDHRNAPWQSLPRETQHILTILCEEVQRRRIEHEFIRDYMYAVARAADLSPRAPGLSRLDFGSLVHICLAMNERPPTDVGGYEMHGARDRLCAISDEREFVLSQKLCSLAHADLQWLSQYGVDGQNQLLGHGSVVILSGVDREPVFVVRPEVLHKHNQTTQTIERELAYIDFHERTIRA